MKLGRDLDRIEKDSFRFCWIADFPMYEWDEENKCVRFSHNPVFHAAGGHGSA